MSDLSFFDSNGLLYADDKRFAEKRKRAVHLFATHLAEETAIVSLQVLQEYFVCAVQKLKVPAEDAQRRVSLIAKARVVRFFEEDVISAIDIHRLNKISFWDALIVHAAEISGAAVLYSEDLQHGSKIRGVLVVNPFSERRGH